MLGIFGENNLNLWFHAPCLPSLVNLQYKIFIVRINKKVDIKFSAQIRFWNNLHQVRSKSKDWKAK
jgi:hypothetical protein